MGIEWEVGRNCVLVETHENTFHGALTCDIIKIYFLLGKHFGGTRHPCRKNERTLDRFFEWGGGVHVKACCLIA